MTYSDLPAVVTDAEQRKPMHAKREARKYCDGDSNKAQNKMRNKTTI
jgi:hypothetical protein